MRRNKAYLLSSLLALIVCCFQACTGCSEAPPQFSTASHSASGGDGEPIEGKPAAGTYYRLVPGHQCGGRDRVHSLVEVTSSSISVEVTNPANCGVTRTQVQLTDVQHSPLKTDYLGWGEGIYKLYDREPDPAAKAGSVAETWCRLRRVNQVVDVAIEEELGTGRLRAEVSGARLERGSWAIQPSESHDVVREAVGSISNYVSDPGSLQASALKLRIDRATKASDVGVSGHIEVHYGGAKIDSDIECRVGSKFDVESEQKPTFAVDFSGGVLPQSFSYQRTGAASYFDSTGSLRSASVNQPRFDHDPVSGRPLGLLLEETRSNQLRHSGNLLAADWVGLRMRIVREGALAGLDRFRVEKNDPGALESWRRIVQKVDVVAGRAYTVSFFAERGNQDTARIMVFQAADSEAQVDFDLTTGNSSVAYSNLVTIRARHVVPVGAGYRISVTFVPSVTALIDVGIGTPSTSLGAFIYATGAQLEVGETPSSYIATQSAPVTRGEDFLRVSQISWFRGDAGTMMVGVSRPGLDEAAVSIRPLICSIKGAGTDAYDLSFGASTGYGARFEIEGASTEWFAAGATNAGPSARQRLALAYRAGDSLLMVNGIEIRGPANTPVGINAQSFEIGGSGSGKWNAHVHSLMYWPQRLDDQTIRDLIR